jgi:hypothetical protein
VREVEREGRGSREVAGTGNKRRAVETITDGLGSESGESADKTKDQTYSSHATLPLSSPPCRKIVGVVGRTATLLGHTPRRQLSLPAQKLLQCTVLGVQVKVKSSLRSTDAITLANKPFVQAFVLAVSILHDRWMASGLVRVSFPAARRPVFSHFHRTPACLHGLFGSE